MGKIIFVDVVSLVIEICFRLFVVRVVVLNFVVLNLMILMFVCLKLKESVG